MWFPLLIACTEPVLPAGEDGLRVVTWNTGTTEGLPHDAEPSDGYDSDDATVSDQWYGDGLAWLPAIDAARSWLAAADPDVVVFQELFFSDNCADIPEEHQRHFVCSEWEPGDLTVVQDILGSDYQVACHAGKDDKCAAVHRRVGRFAGCDEDFCIDGLAGEAVADCGRGARVAWGNIERDDAASITLVSVHGSSGLTSEDQACRTAQVDQVFVEAGDGLPAARGALNVVLGDLNTDPGRWQELDESAARWADFVGDDKPFAWISEVGPDAPASYGGVADIDHVASDSATGACVIAGLNDGAREVIDAVYFDHRPVLCDLTFTDEP